MKNPFASYRWIDHPDNPLIHPPGNSQVIADPSVIAPHESPDGRFHMFAHSKVGIFWIHHYVSDDGLRWKHQRGPLFAGLRPYVLVDGGYHLFYEHIQLPNKTVIAVRYSKDLITFGKPKIVLTPEFSWERSFPVATNGNPCVVRHDKTYWLYFSAALTWLSDCLYPEPTHIGLAHASTPHGPYRKLSTPILSPSPATAYRNLGAGSFKVIPPGRDHPQWVAFNNGIYKDTNGKSRSDIRMLTSPDGVTWKYKDTYPIIMPDNGWKRAFIYAMSYCYHKGKALLYYNARDGWAVGKERIGLATAYAPSSIF